MPVSRDSQRRRESGCVKRMICVKRVSGGAWGKELESADDPQSELFESVVESSKRCTRSAMRGRFPGSLGERFEFPFQHERWKTSGLGIEVGLPRS